MNWSYIMNWWTLNRQKTKKMNNFLEGLDLDSVNTTMSCDSTDLCSGLSHFITAERMCCRNSYSEVPPAVWNEYCSLFLAVLIHNMAKFPYSLYVPKSFFLTFTVLPMTWLFFTDVILKDVLPETAGTDSFVCTPHGDLFFKKRVFFNAQIHHQCF